MVKRKRPEQDIDILMKSGPPRNSDVKVDREGRVIGIDKHATTMSVVNAEEAKGSEVGGFLSPTLFTPNEEQLEKINQFTLRRVSADEVACFTTHSCNDLPDRDDDRFTTRTVKGFAELPHPYSPVGKSYMVGHDYSQLAVGRIFNAASGTAKSPDGKSFTKLENDVYIPRLPSTQDFIAKMEFGVNWAVSVGVQLQGAKCAIGKEHDWGWFPWFCSKGHEKGFTYDPDSDAEDEYGWPAPVSEGASKGVKCIRQLDGAKDMYELSQVFLGAQYMAQIDKNPEFAGVVKSAHSGLLNLNYDEARKFFVPVPTLPVKFQHAAKNHTLTENDGTFRYVDSERLIWTFTPGQDTEPLLIGKQNDTDMTLAELRSKRAELESKMVEANKSMADANFVSKDSDAVAAIVPKLRGLLSELDAAITSQNLDQAAQLMDQANDAMEELYDALYDDEPDPDQPEDDDADADSVPADSNITPPKNAKGEHMSKKAIAAALIKVPLSKSAVDALDAAPDDETALEAVFKAMAAEHKALAEKAAVGDTYVKHLRAETLDWYRKAHQDPKLSGIDVSHVEKLLEILGDNADAIKTLRDDYEATAKARFPAATRASSFPDNANDPTSAADVAKGNETSSNVNAKRDARVARIHG